MNTQRGSHCGISRIPRCLRSMVSGAVIGFAAVLAAGPASAQRTTGEIIGTVTDNSGAVLPGVTVELTGEHMPGSQSSVTSDRGTYRFVNLPPGSYDLLFTLQGFRTLRHPAMRVSVGATITVDVSLEIGEFAEAVTVVAQTPTVDTTTNKVSTIYEEEWIRSAPQGRSDFFDLKTSV